MSSGATCSIRGYSLTRMAAIAAYFPGDTVKAVMALSIACCFVGFCKIGVIYKNCAGVNGAAVVVSDRTGDFDRVRCKSGKRKYTSAYSTQKFFLFS